MNAIRNPAARRQQGVATLIVVMVLFFVMSLVAAYSSRNIVFEQKTSANQYQANVSFEAAEAGLEWTLSLLNSGRITASCSPSGVDTDTNFRTRYLSIDPVGGGISVDAAVESGTRQPVCWSTNGDWSCDCPSGAGAAALPAIGNGLAPTFRVRFLHLNTAGGPAPQAPSLVSVEVLGCTTADAACLTFPAPHPTRCGGTVCALLALSPGVKSPPAAALTSKLGIDVGGAAMSIYNTASRGSGMTILAGGVVNTGGMTLRTVPGTPVARTVVQNDGTLTDPAFDNDRMFASVFGLWKETYWQQPGAVTLDCAAGCDATDLRDAVRLNPGRVILADGDLSLDDGTDFGTAAAPITLVVRGNLTFSAAGTTDFWGLVYAQTADWATDGAGTVHGAAVAEGRISGTGAYTVAWDPVVLDALRWTTGSFVVVPGSWRDYP